MKKKRVAYAQLDKGGIVLKGFISINNELRVRISNDCGPYGFSVYTALLSHCNQKKNECFPSIPTLEKETGISRRKISDVLTDLVENGYIIIKTGGVHNTNKYWFPCEKFFNKDNIDSQATLRNKRNN